MTTNADFEKMKKALSESVANHFPDYNLDTGC